jgi:cytochrome b subunit of formate dehydrogenase
MVLRWNRTQVIQHLLLLGSGLVLGLTGLALKYHDHRLAGFVLRHLGGAEMSGTLHRAAAVVLILTVLLHLAHAAVTEYGHQEFRRIMLGLQDFRDFLQALRFNLGRAPAPPQTRKYGFQEKFQYWAAALIILVMVPTGLVLWFENQAMMFLPKWVYDATLILHGGAGLFFFAVIILAHLYYVHLDPAVFPMNWMWLTGAIPEEQLRLQHPLEYEELKAVPGSGFTVPGPEKKEASDS